MILGNSLWVLVKQSDAATKFILVLLLVMSIVCWSVFFYKLILFRIKRKQMRQALTRLRNVHEMDQLLVVTSEVSGTISGYFLSRNLSSLKQMLEGKTDTRLEEYQWNLMQDSMAQSVEDMIEHEHAYLPWLSTTAAVAPLLGLFGTVWGLVHAFIGITEKQSADIATIAPGIAEALLTTLMGLIVAIPALIMYNYLLLKVRRLEQMFIALADRMSLVVQRLLS